MVRLNSFFNIFFFLIAFGSVLSYSSFAYSDDEPISISVSPKSGTIDDSYTLTITVRGADLGEVPHLSGGEDFTLQYVGSSSSIQIINGRTSAQVDYTYMLTPKRSGDIKTPFAKITINGRVIATEPLVVSVKEVDNENPTDNAEPSQDIFLKRTLSKATVYEGQQVTANLDLYSVYSIEEGSFDELHYEGFWKEDYGKPYSNRKNFSGRLYTVHSVKHALFPLKSGEIKLPPAILNLSVRKPRQRGHSPFSNFGFFDPDMFNSLAIEKKRVRSTPDSLTVLPLPDIPNKFRTNLKQFANTEPLVGQTEVGLAYDPSPVQIGAGKTVTVSIKSTANLRRLKELNLRLPQSVRQYSDKPEEKLSVQNNLISYEKRFKLSLVSDLAGRITIDPITLLTFNPENGLYEKVSTREISYLVEGVNPVEINSNQIQETDKPKEAAKEIFKFKEETTLEWLARTVTFSLAIFTFSIVLLLALTVWFVFYLLKSGKKTKLVFPDLSLSNTYYDLHEDFLASLSKALGDKSLILRGEALRSLIDTKVKDSKLKEELNIYLDQISSAAFSDNGSTSYSLAELGKNGNELLLECIKYG